MGHMNKEYKFVMIVMKTSRHIFWHAINKHEKNIIYNYEFFLKKAQEYCLVNFCFLTIP
jgi:hypothetical protein